MGADATPAQVWYQQAAVCYGEFSRSYVELDGSIAYSNARLAGHFGNLVLAAVSPQGWQPIESAPKEGWFLASSVGMVHIVCRLDGEILDVGADLKTGEMGLHEPAFLLTHWKPVPSPPRVAAGPEEP